VRIKPDILKLSSLFAKYLYFRKELKLPGIGVFTLDPSVIVPDATEKNFNDFMQHIRYTQTPVATPDEEFINFIRTETGKIRPLAESDLDSYLTDGTILLNIGKPFQLEGIGSIIKTREGIYEFTPGEPIHNRLENYNNDPGEENTRRKTAFSDAHAKSGALRTLVIAVIVFGGLTFVIWGGYTLYNKNPNNSSRIKEGTSDTVAITPAPPSRANMIFDSAKKLIESTTAQIPGTYKFIIERTANKARATRRFNQLKEGTAIKMESMDSTLFSLYFLLPAQPSDTARIRDSLRIWYGRKKVFVEH
jgi:hypothetical protein